MTKISYNTSLVDTIIALTEVGFIKVFEQPFKGRYGIEQEFIFARHDGFIVHFDTFTWEDETAKLNSGKLHYCWQTDVNAYHSGLTSSGFFTVFEENSKIWMGDHDLREGMKTIANIQRYVKVLNTWNYGDRKAHTHWFINYGEHRDHNLPYIENYYSDIVKTKIASLPQWVQKIINLPIDAK